MAGKKITRQCEYCGKPIKAKTKVKDKAKDEHEVKDKDVTAKLDLVEEKFCTKKCYRDWRYKLKTTGFPRNFYLTGSEKFKKISGR